MKNNFLYNQFKTILSTNKFKIVFLLIICNSLYGAAIANENLDYLSAMLNVLSFPYFNIILLVIIILSTFFSISYFNESNEYIIRLGSVNKKNSQMIKLCILQTIFLCMFQIFLLIIMMNFVHNNNFNFSIMVNGVNIVLYIIFFLLKVLLLFSIITYGIIILSLHINKYFLSISILIIFLAYPLGIYNGNFYTDFFPTSLFISDYFYCINSINFLSEIIGTIGYSFFLYFFIICVYNLCIVFRRKDLFCLRKTWIYRNIFYLIIDKKKYLLLYTILISFALVIRKITNLDIDENIYFGLLGLKFGFDADILFMLSYFLYLVYYIYISMSLFVNDLHYEKQNIFLRTTYKKWLNKTLLSLVIGTLIIRMINYVTIIALYYIIGGELISIMSILKFFVVDVIYILVIQVFGVLAYNNYVLRRKFIMLINCLIIILFILIKLLKGLILLLFIVASAIFLLVQIFIIRKCSYTLFVNEGDVNNGN